MVLIWYKGGMEYLKSIAAPLLPLVVLILVGVAYALGRKAIAAFEAKTGLDLSTGTETSILGVIDLGIGAAEKWAANVLKSTGKKPPSVEKLDKAMAFIVDELKRRNLPEMARDAVVKLIEAKLGVIDVAKKT